MNGLCISTASINTSSTDNSKSTNFSARFCRVFGAQYRKRVRHRKISEHAVLDTRVETDETNERAKRALASAGAITVAQRHRSLPVGDELIRVSDALLFARLPSPRPVRVAAIKSELHVDPVKSLAESVTGPNRRRPPS